MTNSIIQPLTQPLIGSIRPSARFLVNPVINNNLLYNTIAFGNGLPKNNLVDVDGSDFVSSWNGVNGTVINATQASGVRQPKYILNRINGLPAIRFVGTGAFSSRDFLDISALTINPSTTDLTMFFVINWGPFITAQFLISQKSGTGIGVLIGIDGTGQLFAQGGSNSVIGAVVPTIPAIYKYTLSGNNVDIEINNVNELSGSIGTVTSSTAAWRISGNGFNGPDPTGAFFDGDAGEIIIYDRLLTGSESTQVVNNYLSPKWKITI